jgi:hypothetical protein
MDPTTNLKRRHLINLLSLQIYNTDAAEELNVRAYGGRTKAHYCRREGACS